MSDGGKGLRVLMVRHAQSQNNIVQARVQAKIKAGVTPQQAQNEWLSARQDDPDLSPEGYEQLNYLRMFSKRLPANTRCKTFRIYTSPMRRACATAKCLEEGLGHCRTICMPELVEGVCVFHVCVCVCVCVCVRVYFVIFMYLFNHTHTHTHTHTVGGVYHAFQDAQGNWQKGPGAALTAGEIQQQYQFNVGNLPESGPWDGGRGFESTVCVDVFRCSVYLRTSTHTQTHTHTHTHIHTYIRIYMHRRTRCSAHKSWPSGC
jgi:hypothetical protein